MREKEGKEDLLKGGSHGRPLIRHRRKPCGRQCRRTVHMRRPTELIALGLAFVLQEEEEEV